LNAHDFEGTGSFTFDFDFHCDVFDEEERREVIRHFLKVFDALLENPSAQIDGISLLDEPERRRIVEDWNASTWRPHGPQTLPGLFEAVVKNNPCGTALIFNDQEVSYETVNAQANRLARHLRARGAGPEKVVALCVEPSVEAIIAILAILKSGAAYLPLDPEYPRERLDFMLKDSGASLLLSEKRIFGSYPHLADLSFSAVVFLDDERESIARRDAANLEEGPAPENLAYIIYTSGTSGAPKGVMIEHAAICNRLQWGVEHYGLNASDRVLQKASFAFDASVWEIFEPLIAGAAIVMARPHGRLDIDHLGDLMAQEKVTVAEFSPSLLRVLIDENKFAACDVLKRVFSGGEVLTADLQNAFFAQSQADLYNTYGPTEASVDVAHWKCGREADAENIPIGRPIAGVRIYILDDALQPTPVRNARRALYRRHRPRARLPEYSRAYG
jgi:amino acid adenylation domain-containing protein